MNSKIYTIIFRCLINIKLLSSLPKSHISNNHKIMAVIIHKYIQKCIPNT